MRFVCVFVAVLSFVATGATATARGATVAFGTADTLIVTAEEANALQFRLTDDQTQDDLISDTGFSAYPAECTNIDFNVPTHRITCPGSTNLRLALGSGANSVIFNHPTNASCFVGYEINLGDGNNQLTLPASCPVAASTITVTAGSGTDTLRGGLQGPVSFVAGGGNDDVTAGPGNDIIHGGGGNDRLFGEAGHDQVFGDAGNDKVQGDNGSDKVDGGAGTDELYGGIASCSVFCSSDPDVLLARDGERDLLNCGGGADTAQVDQLDVVAFCASIDRPSVAGPVGGAPAKASFVDSKRTVKVSRQGRFTYSFRAGSGLRGNAGFRSVKKVRTSRLTRVTLARKSFQAASSGKVTLKIKLTRRKLAILRRNRKIKTKVTVTLKNAAGLSSVTSTRVTLKRQGL